MWPVNTSTPRAGGRAAGTLLLVLGAQRIDCGLVDGRGRWHEDSVRSVALGGGAAAPSGLPAALAALDVPPAAAVRVLVADCWLAAAAVPWQPGLARGAGAACARAQLAQAGHDVGPDDTVLLDDAPYGAPRLALAYPSVLLAALRQLAARSQAPLASVLPLSLAAAALAGGAAALAVLDQGLLVLLRGREELVWRHADDARAALAPLWQRLALRDPALSALSGVAVLDLTAGGADAGPGPGPGPFVPLALPAVPPGAPPALPCALRLAALAPVLRRRDALDAVAAWPAVPRWRWLPFALLALLAGVLGAQALRAGAHARSLQERAAAAVAPAAPPAPAWSAAELARLPAVNAAVRELNLPFAPVLRALEPPPQLRVAVLGVTTAPGAQASSVKIVAEARSAGDMAGYVRFLAERKPLNGAYLLEHEIAEGEAERPYRFTVEATWTD